MADEQPKHFDSAAVEQRWSEAWERDGIYRWDPARSRADTFVVDTPPPTVSGSLHIGHVFSYTQTDVVVRFRRMRGKNIYYPMGWDDNGLPTERRVQNFFHVRVDVTVPYEKDLALEQATPEQIKAQPPRKVSRKNFIELCHQVTAADEKVFKEMWTRLALSVDWKEEYATIGDHARKIAQLSFRDLYEKGHIYSSTAPTMWDVDFQTAVAQAEVEDRPQRGLLAKFAFAIEGSGETFTIATTRPELLAACVGVTAHPSDARYRHLFGRTAITPLFQAPVRIFPSEDTDPEKGTGIQMVCTFGDSADVDKWRKEKLPLRQILDRNGRLSALTFGSEQFPSNDPEAANAAYADLIGKTVHTARELMLKKLALDGTPAPVERAVKYFEKGDRPLELIATRQWFVRLLNQKEELLAYGRRIAWHPESMHARYSNWTQGLMLDWCISRQRFFGVSFPVWYALDDQSAPDYEHPIVALPETMPVDPMSDVPPGYREEQRGQPNGFIGEADVFDTWFTSSMTPQLASKWVLDETRHAKLFPADVRPQSHEIIRTWAFYTVAKSMLHENKVPWEHVLISGWILDPDRKKMSKSKGNTITPMALLEKYGSDAVRYWASAARLGADTAFDESVLAVGKRLVTKLYNAGKYVLGQNGSPGAITDELDRAFVAELDALIEKSTAGFESYDHASALAATFDFFWASFTDSYLELAKGRARGEGGDQGSAIAALRLGLDVLLRLFAPFLPYVTEEVWSWFKTGTVHTASWPAPSANVEKPSDPRSLQVATAAMAAINKAKSAQNASVGRACTTVELKMSPKTRTIFDKIAGDVARATRTAGYTITESGDDAITVINLELA